MFIGELCKKREALKHFKLTETICARLNLSEDEKSKVGSCVFVYPNLTHPPGSKIGSMPKLCGKRLLCGLKII